MGDISRDMPVFTESRAAQMYQAVDRYNVTEWDAITKSVFGFSISTMPVKELVRQDIDEEALWVSENLDLITSIDTETLQKVKGELIRAIQDNVDRDIVTSVLMQAIRRIVEVEKNRARLIATDPVGKLNGRLTMKRQQDAGITEFKWKSAGDSRVRPLHQAYNGHVYKWSKPPADGYPGYPIRCRCVALPVIDLDKVVVQPQRGSVQNAAELQRYGRNKNTLVNHAYIESGEYRRKFDQITDNPDVNRVLYQKAKEMLYHRSGTEIEDMYWIDGDTGDVIASVTNETIKRGIRANKAILNKLANYENIIALHTHPSSMPPSGADFIAFFERKYSKALGHL